MNLLSGIAFSALEHYYSKGAPLPKIPEDGDRLEDFSLIVSLAEGLRLPRGSKPVRENHQIKWHRPSGQTITRTFCNAWGNSVAAHEKIIRYWPDTIETAIRVHIQRDIDEGLYEILKIKICFCKDAVEMLQDLKNYTYSTENDGTCEQLELCINKLQVLLANPIVKLLQENREDTLPKIAAPPQQDKPKVQPANDDKEKKAPAKAEDVNPIPNEPIIEAVPEKKIEIEISKSQEGNALTSSKNDKPVEVSERLRELLRELWNDQAFLITLKSYFADADCVPPIERETSETFKASLTAIETSLGQRCSKFNSILSGGKKY